MLVFSYKIATLFFIFINIVIAYPINDKALYDNDGPEERRKHKRPCKGRAQDEGRTFFDWSFQYLDVNYNYNYNINCGENGGGGHESQSGGGGHRPHGGHFNRPHPGNQGIHNRPETGGGGNNSGGGHRPILGSLLSQTQSQAQNLFGDNGVFNNQFWSGLGSWIPQLGESFGSLFDGGIFNVFNNNNNNVNRPQNYPPSTSPPVRPQVTTSKPIISTEDPDDIIYNDEKPVHEDHDPILPDNNYKPGQYILGYNPLFGQYTQALPNLNFDINPNKVVRQFNRGVRKFVRPLTHLFRK